MSKVLRHIYTGNIGVLVEKNNSRYGEIFVIKLSDNKHYYAPAGEFEEVSSNSHQKELTSYAKAVIR